MNNENIIKKLDKKNTKPTSMRIRIYDLLSQQSGGLSISEIEQYLNYADRTTVYRTLKTFENKGIVHQIQEENITKYMLCHDDCDEQAHKDWHLHFYCKLCKKTLCREDVILPHSFQTDLRIDEVRFFAKGICEQCLNS